MEEGKQTQTQKKRDKEGILITSADLQPPRPIGGHSTATANQA